MKTYLFLQLDEVSKQRLGDFMSRYLPLRKTVPPSKYHLTIIYSFSSIPDAYQFNGRELSEKVFAKRYRFFKSQKHGKILVLELDFPEAIQFHNYLSNLGGEVDIPRYIPHISLAYDVKEKIRLRDIPVPNFPLFFDRIIVEEK